MKTLLKKAVLLFSLLLIGGMMFAQTGELPPLPTPEDGVNSYLPWVDLLYAAFVMIAGWLSAFIPGIRNIPDKAWRIAAIALVGAGIFLIGGWSNGLSLIFAYLIATKVYELFVKRIAPTPDTPGDIDRKEKLLQVSKQELKSAA
jgi:hypothetical protein